MDKPASVSITSSCDGQLPPLAFIAFSTANPGAVGTKGLHQLTMLPNDSLDPIFLATVQATEEAVINAMIAADTMTGIDNHTAIALPHDRLREVLKKYNRLEK